MMAFIVRWAEQRRATVLMALSPSAPSTGLEVADRVAAGRGNAFFVWSGGVLRVLHTLEEDGLVSSFYVPAPIDSDRSGRPRWYYELTDYGRSERIALGDGRTL